MLNQVYFAVKMGGVLYVCFDIAGLVSEHSKFYIANYSVYKSTVYELPTLKEKFGMLVTVNNPLFIKYDSTGRKVNGRWRL